MARDCTKCFKALSEARTLLARERNGLGKQLSVLKCLNIDLLLFCQNSLWTGILRLKLKRFLMVFVRRRRSTMKRKTAVQIRRQLAEFQHKSRCRVRRAAAAQALAEQRAERESEGPIETTERTAGPCAPSPR
jgi:hypothetical protein